MSYCPAIVALELGNYLVHTADSQPRIRRLILDDIAPAEARRDAAHTAKLCLFGQKPPFADQEKPGTRPGSPEYATDFAITQP